MHADTLHRWKHPHTFGTDEVKAAERRPTWVIGITATMMVVEIAAGMIFGSMALLADGWHMGTHAAALGITVFAYAYARRHADDPRYTFGTGKVGALGGFASAVGLAVVAILVFGESVARVAARHRVAAQQVTTWRRLAREGGLVLPVKEGTLFAPLMIGEPSSSAAAPEAASSTSARRWIEIVIGAVTVRVAEETSAARIAAIAARLAR